MITDPASKVRHNTERHRFEIAEDGLLAVADYDPVEGAWVFGHTETPRQWQGGGVAGALVKAGLEAAREAGVKVIPTCSYVATYMKRHRETHDLVHPRYRDALGL